MKYFVIGFVVLLASIGVYTNCIPLAVVNRAALLMMPISIIIPIIMYRHTKKKSQPKNHQKKAGLS